jgi:hypothetical protein
MVSVASLTVWRPRFSMAYCAVPSPQATIRNPVMSKADGRARRISGMCLSASNTPINPMGTLM